MDPENKKEKGNSKVQSVIFGKNWSNKDARKWLKKNNFKPIKRVNKPKGGNSKKFTIIEENKFEKLGFKPIKNKGIFFMIGDIKESDE